MLIFSSKPARRALVASGCVLALSAVLGLPATPLGIAGDGPTIGPSLLDFDVADNVPEDEVRTIEEGIDFGRIYLRDHLGGDIGRKFRRSTTVKIVATGDGNQELGGGGACCTALDSTGRARLFFDVEHPHWSASGSPWGIEANHWKIVAHEYTHAWENWVGCLGRTDPEDEWLTFEAWIIEGVAEYVGFASLIEFGYMTPEDVRSVMLEAAIRTGEIEERLQDLEYIGEPYEIWPGDIGYLAVERIVSRYADGVGAIRAHCEAIADGVSRGRAFKQAFGIRKTRFYRVFPEYLEMLLNEGAFPQWRTLRSIAVTSSFGSLPTRLPE